MNFWTSFLRPPSVGPKKHTPPRKQMWRAWHVPHVFSANKFQVVACGTAAAATRLLWYIIFYMHTYHIVPVRWRGDRTGWQGRWEKIRDFFIPPHYHHDAWYGDVLFLFLFRHQTAEQTVDEDNAVTIRARPPRVKTRTTVKVQLRRRRTRRTPRNRVIL